MEGNVSLEETEWEKIIRGEERICQKGKDGKKYLKMEEKEYCKSPNVGHVL
jgi:hypothetical protein